ncbi:MAG: glycosyltransferase family 2 protein [Thermoguttaceae bacterium]|nr:glycosyltransferase family 2 protein [Thermoguttaceae bacterium]
MKSTVSIALCTFNGERFLREQLASYAAQTVLPDEVVVCDDGSTDGTLEILEEWAETVPFEVRIFRNEQNLGYAQNFGKAVSLCTGGIIFLSDQDDVWMPEKIERMVRVFEEDPTISTVISDSEIIDAEGHVCEGSSSGTAQLWYFDEAAAFCMDQSPETFVGTRGCASAIRQEIRDLYLPIPQNWTHDIWLMVTAPLAGRVVRLEEPLFRYRLYSGNTSNAGLFQDRLKSCLWKRDNYFWNIETQYWVWLPMIEEFRKRLSCLKDPAARKKMEKRLRLQDRYFTYRNRVQRNFLKCGVFWFLLIVQGTYFRFPFPWRSMKYDLVQGFKKIFSTRRAK